MTSFTDNLACLLQGVFGYRQDVTRLSLTPAMSPCVKKMHRNIRA